MKKLKYDLFDGDFLLFMHFMSEQKKNLVDKSSTQPGSSVLHNYNDIKLLQNEK